MPLVILSYKSNLCSSKLAPIDIHIVSYIDPFACIRASDVAINTIAVHVVNPFLSGNIG